jgi:hypothetical protein
VFHDEATNRKIHRHLSDKNDVISEEDIRNVRTDFTEITTASSTRASDEKEQVSKEDGEVVNGKNDDNSILTPWSVLGS